MQGCSGAGVPPWSSSSWACWTGSPSPQPSRRARPGGGGEEPGEQSSEDDDKLPPAGLVIALIDKSSRKVYKRLHRWRIEGACHRVPGIDYRKYEAVPRESWETVAYDDHCHQCWRGHSLPLDTKDADQGQLRNVVNSDSSMSPSSDEIIEEEVNDPE